jgi:hypothetical protein
LGISKKIAHFDHFLGRFCGILVKNNRFLAVFRQIWFSLQNHFI